VVCVWQPGDVGFVLADGHHINAAEAAEVRQAAADTAAEGASLATKAGFPATSVAVEAVPTWKGIVEASEEHGAPLIVIGSHRRGGIAGHLRGSIADAVVAHATATVLIVHEQQ
jgi:nucleotide-binding universal stress UspA family protein